MTKSAITELPTQYILSDIYVYFLDKFLSNLKFNILCHYLYIVPLML